MRKMRAPWVLVAIAIVIEGAALVAQPHHAGEGFVSVRGGTNLVGNAYRVRESRAEPGGGGSIGAYLSPLWAVEFETWVRASNPECCAPRRREMLYSLSVVRTLMQGTLQPYMLGGLTLLRSDESEMQVRSASARR